MPHKNIIFLNPSSGQSRALKNLEKLESLLKNQEVDYELIITESENHFRKLIQKYAHKAKSITTAGGDSSFTILVNEVIALGAKTPMGIIPLGSSDDIAREYGIFGMEESVRALARGKTALSDVGQISTKSGYKYYFPGQANVGIGVFVNRFVADAVKKTGFLNKNQTLAGIRAMHAAFKSKIVPQGFVIESDGFREEDEFVSLVFSKIRYWAGGRIFLPRARPDDGRIHILKIRRCSFFKVLGIMLKAQKAKHLDSKIVGEMTARKIVLESETPFQLQVDGDILKSNGRELSFNKIKIDVLKKKIRIIVPAE